MTIANPSRDSLRKILDLERSSGFQDSAVIGGLDRFLRHWSSELRPLLGGLGSYSILTPIQREDWVREAETKLTPPGGRPARAARGRGRPRKPVVAIGLDAGVAALKGVRTQTVGKLKRLGVETVEDLLYLFPHRHNDFANVRKVSELEPGLEQTVVVNV